MGGGGGGVYGGSDLNIHMLTAPYICCGSISIIVSFIFVYGIGLKSNCVKNEGN